MLDMQSTRLVQSSLYLSRNLDWTSFVAEHGIEKKLYIVCNISPLRLSSVAEAFKCYERNLTQTWMVDMVLLLQIAALRAIAPLLPQGLSYHAVRPD